VDLDRKVRLLTEQFARTVDRRKFLKQAGTSLFAGVAAFAAGHFAIARASADGADDMPPWPPTCAPPGPYCNLTGQSDGSGCMQSRPYDPSASCFQHLYNGRVLQCRVYYIYQAGCWTTPVQGGRWTCCDCECPTGDPPPNQRRTCGCAQFSTNPPPRPDGPQRGLRA
jgi:hypothetical protein